MRYAFGLVGLLVGFGIVIWLMSDSATTAIDARNKVDPQLKQITGRSEDGTPAGQSATLQAQTDSSGKLRGLLVADIVPGGAYDKHFGLKQYDLIVQVGPLELKTQDEGMAEALMTEAMQRNQEIVVIRGNNKLTLPASSTAAATPAAPVDAANPSAPAAAPTPPKSRGLQGQLEGIQGIPTH